MLLEVIVVLIWLVVMVLMFVGAGLAYVDQVGLAFTAIGLALALAFGADRIQKTEAYVWHKAQGTDLIGDYRVYLSSFPSGTHADAARTRYESLMAGLRSEQQGQNQVKRPLGTLAAELLGAMELSGGGSSPAVNRLDVVVEPNSWPSQYTGESTRVRSLIEGELGAFAEAIGADSVNARRRRAQAAVVCRYSGSEFGTFVPSSGIGKRTTGLSLSVDCQVYRAGASQAGATVSVSAVPDARVLGGGEGAIATNVKANLQGELKKVLALK